MSASANQSHTVSINGLKLHYWESRPHLPSTIVMLRGFRSSDAGLMKLAEEFSDYHLIVPDFPGYGETAELEVEHSVAAYAQVIADFIVWLKSPDITLLGHSFGALVALVCAAENPTNIARLILVAPVPKPNLMLRASSLYYIIGRALPPPLNRGWLTSRAIQNPVREYVIRTHDRAIHDEVMAEGEKELSELKPKINIENYLSVVHTDPTKWVRRLKIPTLIIAGDQDRLTPTRNVLKTYTSPFITIKIVPGIGHYAPSEGPAEIADVAKAWLKSKLTTERTAR